MDALRVTLDPWLGEPRWKQTQGRVTFIYRFDSEDQPSVPLRLKVEINSREHFTVFGLRRMPFSVQSRWFDAESRVRTYTLEELLGTKLRALYQRKKGRDLFDLAAALQSSEVSSQRVVDAFTQCLAHGGHQVRRAQFEANLFRKLRDPVFAGDLAPLLASGYTWDMYAAATTVQTQLVALLPGESWKGDYGEAHAGP